MKIDVHIYRDQMNRWLLSLGLVLVGSLWAVTTVLVKRQTEITPLHYTIYFGIDLSGQANRLWLWPAFGTVSWLSHVWLGRQSLGPALTRTWLIMNVLMNGLLLASLLTLAAVIRRG